MAKKQIRSERESTVPKFCYSVGTGLLTGMMLFVVTNGLLPPAFMGQVQGFIWRSWQGSEPRQPEKAVATATTFEAPSVSLKPSQGRAIDPKGVPPTGQAFHIKFVSKDAVVITVYCNSVNEMPSASGNEPAAVPLCSHETLCASPWFLVDGDAGAR